MDTTAAIVLSNCLTLVTTVVGSQVLSRIKRGDRDRDALLLLQQDSVERAKQVDRFEQRLEKLCQDVNRIGTAMRDLRMMWKIASATGEIPRFDGSSSGEGEKVI